jgi:hypothetical protein
MPIRARAATASAPTIAAMPTGSVSATTHLLRDAGNSMRSLRASDIELGGLAKVAGDDLAATSPAPPSSRAGSASSDFSQIS